MSTGEPSGSVTFTTKELILQMDAKIDTLVSLVSSKAEQNQVIAMQQRLQALETSMEHRNKTSHQHANTLLALEARIVAQENNLIKQNAVAEYRKWILAGGGITGILILLNIVAVVKALM